MIDDGFARRIIADALLVSASLSFGVDGVVHPDLPKPSGRRATPLEIYDGKTTSLINGDQWSYTVGSHFRRPS